MQQQVSSYLLQGFICQKDPPSVKVWQDTPGTVPPREGHSWETALPLSFQSEPQDCTQAQTLSIYML